MKQATALRLNALNARFYAEHAREFSATRERGWPGVERALQHALPAGTAGDVAVLDVGCGNGRALPALRARCGPGLRYLGVDASEPLLAIARSRWGGAETRFERADFVAVPPERALPAGRWQLVLLLGVLHGVPSELARRALLAAAAARVAAGGALVLTIWRYDRDPRCAERRIPAERWPELAPGLAPDDLEPGDELLGFGSDREAVRYCHFPSAAELARLGSGLSLTEQTRFLSDGAGQQLNEYLVLRAPGAARA